MSNKQFIETNRHSWNKRVPVHVASDFYNVDEFLKGTSSLQNIETQLLGDVRGKQILHLQCHFGQDTISLSRLGAEVTGVDFSDTAIDAAREFALSTKCNTRFICCDIYELPAFLNETFDIVFTSYGTIGWLPDLHAWAAIINQYLKPGGKFIFVEFHPVAWMFDSQFTHIHYSYFNVKEIVETEQGTYADKHAELNTEFITWNHSLSEVVTSLLQNGLIITLFQEYDYSPHNCFLNTEEFEPGKFRIKHLENKIPLVYAIEAMKK
jgi:SAM-dependent methyltransferase